MNDRTDSVDQLGHLMFIIAGFILGPILIGGGLLLAVEQRWKPASGLLIFGGVLVARGVVASRAWKKAIAADRAFESKHRGRLDWMGNPIETRPQQEPNKAPEPTPLPVTPPAEPGVAPGSDVAHL
jgi:hypothetical protein